MRSGDPEGAVRELTNDEEFAWDRTWMPQNRLLTRIQILKRAYGSR